MAPAFHGIGNRRCWERVLRVEAVDIAFTNIKFKQEGCNAIAYLPSIL